MAGEEGAAVRIELERRLGWEFRDRTLLEQALTHRSAAHELGSRAHYERLEFLGDAVLGLVAAEWLYLASPALSEGELSREKGYLISEAVLARHGRGLGLGGALRLGVGEARSGGREKPSILADVVEALLGAVFLDGGLAPARRLALSLLETAAAWDREATARDPKTALQELTQARGWELPVYRMVAEEGPDHEKLFVVACEVGGREVGRASGRTKKGAEAGAAAEALAALARSLAADPS